MRRSGMDSPPGAVPDQLGDFINGKPEDPLHVFGVGRHIGALDYHGAHLGVPVYEFFSSILKTDFQAIFHRPPSTTNKPVVVFPLPVR